MENEKRELNSISIIARPNWTGLTTNTDKRFGDGQNKYCITVPVPMNEEDCQEQLGISFEALIRVGAKQIWYSARNVDNTIKEIREKGFAPGSDDAMIPIMDAVENQMFTATPGISVTKELKELKEGLKGLGMSPAEAIAALKAMKAQQE